MKIDAKLLQESLSFLGLAISKNITDRPITKMVELRTVNGFLVGATSDGVNNIQYKICPTKESLNALVDFEIFNNIIKSCTDEVELKEYDNALGVKSSTMKCKIASIHKRSTCTMQHCTMEQCVNNVDFTSLSEILSVCRSILNTEFSINCYRNIYFNDKIMVTDTDNVAVISKKFFNDNVLLSYKTAELLSKLTTAKYTIVEEEHTHTHKKFKKLYVQTDKADIVCFSENADLFQYDDLNDLFNTVAKDTITINKSELSKGYNIAKLFKTNNLLFVFDTDSVYLRIDQSDFTYKVSDVGISTKHSFVVNEALMKKFLALSNEITISILDGMIKCSAGNIEEIYSVVELQ